MSNIESSKTQITKFQTTSAKNVFQVDFILLIDVFYIVYVLMITMIREIKTVTFEVLQIMTL